MQSIINFGEWLPDLPALGNPGLVKAVNAVPQATSYTPLPGLSPWSSALPGAPNAAAAFRKSSGDLRVFAGTDSGLFLLNSNAVDFTDISAQPYFTGQEDRWNILAFGNNVLASNGAEPPQRYEMGVSAAFSDLEGMPPSYRFAAIVREFLVVGSIGGDKKNRFAWCDRNDITEWTTGLAGSFDIPTGGQVMGITGGEFGVIFQEKQIQRLDFVGGRTIWNRDVVEENKGLLASGSLAKYGADTFFLAEDGFYAFDGTRAISIGNDRVDRTFFADFDQSYAFRVTSTIDPINKLYVVSYPGAGHVMGRPNKLIIYNYQNNRWSSGEIEHEFVYSGVSLGFGLDALSDNYPSLDDLPFSLDSKAWQGGATLLSAFTPDAKAAYFNGRNLPATFETGEVQLIPASRSMVSGTRPLIDGTVSVRAGARGRQADAVTYTAPSALNAIGETPLISEGRYHRFEAVIPDGEDWTHAQGLNVEFEASGVI